LDKLYINTTLTRPTVILADTYFLNVCGTSATQCPDDAGDPPVTQGTAVQTVQSGGCYVLGVSFSIVLSRPSNYFVIVVSFPLFYFFETKHNN
jgi:hypothetical protein